MRSAFLALLLATGLAAAPAHAGDGMVTLKPEQIGHIFCLSRSGNDTGPIEGLLTAGLADAIAAALALNEAWETANPGEKPPLGDGIPWQGWPDYAPECKVGLVTLMKTDARVDIDYAFPDQPDADFTDTLLLKRVEKADDGTAFWRIDNIAYAPGGDLKTALQSAFESQ